MSLFVAGFGFSVFVSMGGAKCCGCEQRRKKAKEEEKGTGKKYEDKTKQNTILMDLYSKQTLGSSCIGSKHITALGDKTSGPHAMQIQYAQHRKPKHIIYWCKRINYKYRRIRIYICIYMSIYICVHISQKFQRNFTFVGNGYDCR